ncbi:MAG: glycosyltransferase family 2 protein [Hyphomicrobiaceae bacterium]|nr:MAG: glycosyltransferase family 2 protein [Hyphomicrobiaceae bacterium]
MTPHVSVVIPMHNSEAWISLALQSVLKQTCPRERLESIVVDDCSTDQSVAVARDFIARHGISGKVIKSGRRKGAGPARNLGWRAAAGTWIQFLDADDILAPSKIEQQTSLAESVPDDVAVICSRWQRLELVDGEWRPIGPVIGPEFDDDVILKIVSVNAGFLGPALIRKSMLETISGFSPDVKHAEDEHLMLKIAAAGGKFAEVACEAPLYFIGQTPSSMSRDSRLELARQHMQNVVIAERMLRERRLGTLSAEENKQISGLCDWTLSEFYEHDRAAFHQYLHWIRDVDPSFVPQHSTKLRLVSHVVGYESAEAVALHYRRLRAWYSRRLSKSQGNSPSPVLRA